MTAANSVLAITVGVVGVTLQSLPALAAFWIGAAGFGWPIRRRLAPTASAPVVVQLASGAGAMLLFAWLLGVIGSMNETTSWALCGVGATLLLWQSASPEHRHLWRGLPMPRPGWAALLWLAPLLIMLVAAACPPGTLWAVEALGYDVMSYHLQLPREWMELGRMEGLHHNVYSYLPNLVEAGFLHLSYMRGSVYDAIYTCQLWSVSMAVLAAAGVAAIARPWFGSAVAVAAGAVLLAVPWVVITGTSAYNETAVLALGAAAMVLVFDPRMSAPGSRGRRRSLFLAGLLLGAATLAKLTAGPMLALPLLAVVAIGLHRDRGAGGRVASVVMFTLGFGLALTPYFIRNAVWTGNPVFPFATEWFGPAHWALDEIARWRTAHAPTGGLTHRVIELLRQWLLNAGYGAVGGVTESSPSATNVAQFARAFGFPLLWSVAALGVVMGFLRREMRRTMFAFRVLVGLQVLFWLLATHLQSRFLMPTLLPGVLLAAMGLAMLPSRRARLTVLIVLPLALSALSLHVLRLQTAAGLPVAAIVDALPTSEQLDEIAPHTAWVGDHPINHLPPGSRTLMVADNSRLLYIRRPMVYASAFDASPLGEVMDEAGDDPDALTAELRLRGVTHVWIHWAELDRLHATYGHDARVSAATLRRLATAWNRLDEGLPAVVGLYELR